ncbi:hypothetical protein RFI_20628, partial [Reticulomyxa filosa]
MGVGWDCRWEKKSTDKANSSIDYLIGLRTWEEVKFVSEYLQSDSELIQKPLTKIFALSHHCVASILHIHLTNRWQRTMQFHHESSFLKISGIPCHDLSNAHKEQWDAALCQTIETFLYSNFKCILPNKGDVKRVLVFPNVKNSEIHGYAYVELGNPKMADDIVQEFTKQFHERYCFFSNQKYLEQWHRKHQKLAAITSKMKMMEHNF